MEFPSLLLSASASSFLTLCMCFVAALCWLFHSRHLLSKRVKLFPGSLGLPLLGETLQFALLNNGPIGSPPPFFASRLQRYGAVFKTHVLGRPAAVSMDPELNSLLLSNDEKLVQVNYPMQISKIVGPALTLHGASHNAMRELANLIASPTAVKNLHVDKIQEHTLAHLRSWSQSSTSEHIVDAQKLCKEWAFKYSVQYLLGLEADDPNTSLLMRDVLMLSVGYSSLPINLPGTTFNKVLKARERVISICAKLAKSRQQQGRRGSKEAKDFLDILLERSDESRELHLDVPGLILGFVLAAYENTAVLVLNIIKFLSENAHVVHELQRENWAIQRTKPDKEKVTWDDYQNMQFTRDVVKEALRLGNNVPSLWRESLQDIFFKGSLIPKGWMVLLNISMVNLNCDYFPNPLKFDPWRWMEYRSNNSTYFTPFGGGLRRCPGSALALFEATIFTHNLVNLYKWKRVPGIHGQWDEMTSFNLPTMHNGLFLTLESLGANSYLDS